MLLLIPQQPAALLLLTHETVRIHTQGSKKKPWDNRVKTLSRFTGFSWDSHTGCSAGHCTHLLWEYRWVKSSWLLTLSIYGRAVRSPFNYLDGDSPWGLPHLCRSRQIGLRDLQCKFSAMTKLGQVSQGNLFWQPTVSWDCGNVCMLSKEQIWFQWSSDEAHASCASCLHQAWPRTCSAYTKTWQGLCQGFLLLWWVRRKTLMAVYHIIIKEFHFHYWWKFIWLSLCWLLRSFFLLLSSNNSIGLYVSHLHLTCIDL